MRLLLKTFAMPAGHSSVHSKILLAGHCIKRHYICFGFDYNKHLL